MLCCDENNLSWYELYFLKQIKWNNLKALMNIIVLHV